MNIRQEILFAIQRDPLGVDELADLLKVSRKSMYDNVRQMVIEGLALRIKDGGQLIYQITEKGRERLANPRKQLGPRNVQATAHHQAQPEAAPNTGSAAQDGSPPACTLGAAQLTQVGGTHYINKNIQPWDAMQAWMSPAEFCGFLRGNVIKYIARANDKGGIEDLRKGWHYLQKLLEVLEARS